MGGICGWIGGSLEPAEADHVLQSMAGKLASIRHQPVTAHRSASYAVAVRTEQDCPHIHSSAPIIAACEGELFWKDAELTRMAREQSDSAAVAESYRRHGRHCLEHIHGSFSLAIYDQDKDLALLAIDRTGIHRMCFQMSDDVLVFGGTTESIAVHPHGSADIDPQSIFDYLYFHMVPSPRTIFRNMEKLLPGEYLVAQRGRVERHFYWHLHFNRNDTAFDALNDEFHQLLERTVSRASRQGEVGTFLSGGTDSSTMAGMLTRVSGAPARTFSIGFEAEGFDETIFATISARHFGTRHVSHYITPGDVADTVPLIARAYDEPFGNASAVPTYLCAKLAGQHGITHMIAGDGGDEIFAGNTRYLKQQIFEYYWRLPRGMRARLIEPLTQRLPGMSLPGLRKLKSYVAQARIPLPDRLETYNFLNRTPLDELFCPSFLCAIEPNEPLALLRDVFERTDSNEQLNRMLHIDMKFTLADNDLRKVSRMCTLAGVTARYPFLDDEMVDFSGRIPARLKIRGGKLRWFFKQSLKDLLAPETLTKSKHGFGLPFGLWLTTDPPLRELAQDSLRTFAGRGYIDPTYVEQLWERHRSGHASYYGVMIWVIMMLEQWLAEHRH